MGDGVHSGHTTSTLFPIVPVQSGQFANKCQSGCIAHSQQRKRHLQSIDFEPYEQITICSRRVHTVSYYI